MTDECCCGRPGCDSTGPYPEKVIFTVHKPGKHTFQHTLGASVMAVIRDCDGNMLWLDHSVVITHNRLTYMTLFAQ